MCMFGIHLHYEVPYSVRMDCAAVQIESSYVTLRFV